MECKCGGQTGVVDSKKYMGTTYRRRRCKVCGSTFWTSEELADPKEITELNRFIYQHYRQHVK